MYKKDIDEHVIVVLDKELFNKPLSNLGRSTKAKCEHMT